MEGGKRTEAGTSSGGGERQEKLREMKSEKPPSEVFDDGDDHEDEEEEDDKEGARIVTAGFDPGPLLSLKEQIEKDKVFFLLFHFFTVSGFHKFLGFLCFPRLLLSFCCSQFHSRLVLNFMILLVMFHLRFQSYCFKCRTIFQN